MGRYDTGGTSDTAGHRGAVLAALDEFEDALRARYERDLQHEKVVQGADGLAQQYISALPPEPVPNSPIEWVSRDATPGWSTRNAAKVRADVADVVPWCDTQNLKVMEAAFDNLADAARLLGREASVGHEDESEYDALIDFSPGTIPALAVEINSDGGAVGATGEWTGPTSIAFKPFGKSAPKTVTHHRNIATSLAMLYAGRIATIEIVRGNTLTAIKGATNALRETSDYAGTAEEWLVYNATVIGVGWVLPPVGVALTVAGSVASYKVTKNPIQVPTHDIGSVIAALNTDLRSVEASMQEDEHEWAEGVQKLEKRIAQTGLDELELHDFTKGGGADTSDAGSGFSVDPTYVTNLAGRCVKASEQYEGVISSVILTDSADNELRGLDGQKTWGDRELIDVRDTFVKFLQTTCARFHEAGTRLYEAARRYGRVDDDAAGALMYEKFSDAPDLNGGVTGNGGSVDSHIGGTDTGRIEDWSELPTEPDPGDDPRPPRQAR